jgi:hypothetical protein
MTISRFVAVLLTIISVAPSAKAEGIWYGPLADEPTPRGFLVDQDYQQLFEPGAPWQHALERVKVFAIGPHFAQAGPEDELRRIFAFLAEHRIALAIAWPVVTARECGAHTEGINHRADLSGRVAARVKRLGGVWAYIAADAVLQAGHYRTESKAGGELNGCQYPIDALAKNVADNIHQIQQVFPAVKWVDGEPLTALKDEQDLSAWIAALRRELGAAAPVSMQLDVQWGRPWQDYARWVVPALQKLGMDYGLIVDADARSRTDEAWVAAARDHLLAWERVIPAAPADVVFEGWNDHPSRVLPEGDPATILSLIGWYCSNSAHRVGCGNGL